MHKGSQTATVIAEKQTKELHGFTDTGCCKKNEQAATVVAEKQTKTLVARTKRHACYSYRWNVTQEAGHKKDRHKNVPPHPPN